MRERERERERERQKSKEREKEQEGISEESVVSMATHLDEGWYDSVNGSADDLEGVLVILLQ